MSYHISYGGYHSILVVNAGGQIKQVYTPFRVSARAPTSGNRRYYLVEEVMCTAEDRLVFVILGVPYFHSLFQVEVHF